MRYTIERREVGKKPWVVIDNHSPQYEDAVVYRFSSEKKAKDFKRMMETEQGAS